MPPRAPHRRDQRIRPVRVERVGLQLVFVHHPIPLLVHPRLPEQARPQLVILIVLAFGLDYRAIVARIQLILGLGEEPVVFDGEVKPSAGESAVQKLDVILFVIVGELL